MGDYIECPICLEDVSGKPVVTVPCCKKQFDLECYLKCDNKCPMCRAITIEEAQEVTVTVVHEVPMGRIIECIGKSIIITLFFIGIFTQMLKTRQT